MLTRHEEMRDQVIAFHKKHPKVWQLFKKFTFERINAGFKHYSSKGIFERIRWETAEADAKENEFKLNNNYHSFYSRAFMKKYPQYDGFFRTRKQTSEDVCATGLRELRPTDFD